MAVHSRDGGVDPSKELLLFLAILLSSRVFQIVCVDDSHDVPELVRPARAMVKPRQMLRLLQHRHIRLFLGDALGDVAHGDDASLVDGVPAGIKVNIESRLEIDSPGEPASDVRLLLFGGFERRVRVHQLLIARSKPRDEQRDTDLASPTEL